LSGYFLAKAHCLQSEEVGNLVALAPLCGSVAAISEIELENDDDEEANGWGAGAGDL
jgi:hypothetical protein